MVAKGHSQKEGVNFNEIFSPVARHTSIPMLLAMIAHQDLKLEHEDSFSSWKAGGGYLDESTRRVCCSEKERSSLQVAKILMWVKVVLKPVVQEI